MFTYNLRPEIINVNKFGHAYIKTKIGNFYWVYKKDYLRSFNQIFKDYMDKNAHFDGAGESINIEYLNFAINQRATLLIAHEDKERILYTPDETILMTAIKSFGEFTDLSSSVLLKLYCELNNLKNQQKKINTYKDTDYNGLMIEHQETTYCFPFKILKRWEIK